jgi:hypothetical protein
MTIKFISLTFSFVTFCFIFENNSTVEISRDIFRILANYRLHHLVNNVAIHIYTHDYIRMEITVLYLKISLHLLGRK